MKLLKGMYYMGVGLSMLVGLWHFFVPALFDWYAYIDPNLKNLIVGIEYTNVCFSFLLFGISLILLVWGPKVFQFNPEALTIFGFLVCVWTVRLALTLLKPWPLEPIAWVAYAQFAGVLIIFLFLWISFIPLCNFCRQKKSDIK